VGQKRGSGDGSPVPSPSGVQGQSPGGGLGTKTHAEYSTEQSHRSSQIAYCSEFDYTLKKFPATTGGHAPMSPLATPLDRDYLWCLQLLAGPHERHVAYKMSCSVNSKFHTWRPYIAWSNSGENRSIKQKLKEKLFAAWVQFTPVIIMSLFYMICAF